MTPKPKAQKRDEAEARNTAWAALDDLTKLDRLHRRRGFSAKQRARLMAPMVAKKRRILAARAGNAS